MVKDFGGVVQVKGEGTIMWKIENDDWVVHTINIIKALYVPESPSCLISPQKCAQQANHNYLKPGITWCATKDLHCIMYWKQEWYYRTTPWDPSINFALIRLAPSSNT